MTTTTTTCRTCWERPGHRDSDCPCGCHRKPLTKCWGCGAAAGTACREGCEISGEACTVCKAPAGTACYDVCNEGSE